MILITIGRNKTNSYVFDVAQNPKHNYVSGDHAELLLLQDGSIYITDKTSANGTTVNGKRIAPESEVTIRRGDKIVFGDAATLDWGRIPTVPPIDPQEWDVYTIGTDYRNRIRISDVSGTVSRFHSMIKVNKRSKKIYVTDHSSNGTYVKGEKIASGVETQVKYKESLRLANVPFSSYWDKIKAPGGSFGARSVIALLTTIAAVLAIGIGYWVWSNKTMTLNDIVKEYGDAVVFVRHDFQIQIETFNGKEFILNLDDNGLPIFDEEGDISLDKVDVDNNQKNTKSITGTAFFVDERGTLVTNRHIVKPWESDLEKYKELIKKRYTGVKEIRGITTYAGIARNDVSVSLNSNSKSDFTECSILSIETDDSAKDVGLLRTKNKSLLTPDTRPINLNKAVLDRTKLKSGDVVYYVGYPIGKAMFMILDDKTATNTHEVRYSPQQGVITQLPDKYKFGHNAESFGGASGSPIFDDRGRLIGIHNSGLSQSGISGFGWGVLAKHIKELYDKENY